MKFILKPSKEGVKLLQQMQQATFQAARVMSQQLKGDVEIVDKNEVINIVVPVNGTRIIPVGSS